MPFDNQLITVLDGALKAIRERLDDDFRTLAQQLSQMAADERARVAADAADAAAADARQQTQLQLAQMRDATQRQIDDMRRATQQQIEQARQAAEQELADARQHAAVEVEDARRTAQTQVDDVQRLMDLRVAAAQEQARNVRVPGAREIAQGVASLDDGRSLGEVLERLANAAASHAERAAIFVVRGGALHEWRRVGFAAAAARRDVPLTDAGFIADVVPSGKPASIAGSPLPLFVGGGTDRDAAAFPVSVGGQVVAVLYCDAPHQPDLQWFAMVEVLARYASRVLETMTIRQATGLGATPPVEQGSHVRSDAQPFGSAS